MGLTYDNTLRYRQKKSLEKREQKPIDIAKNAGFPNCKGLYPDCPEKPSKGNKLCRSCPILDEED